MRKEILRVKTIFQSINLISLFHILELCKIWIFQVVVSSGKEPMNLCSSMEPGECTREDKKSDD